MENYWPGISELEENPIINTAGDRLQDFINASTEEMSVMLKTLLPSIPKEEVEEKKPDIDEILKEEEAYKARSKNLKPRYLNF